MDKKSKRMVEDMNYEPIFKKNQALYKIFEDMAYLMIKMARELRVGMIEENFFYDGDVYAFDSTTISLCLQVFWWSRSAVRKQ